MFLQRVCSMVFRHLLNSLFTFLNFSLFIYETFCKSELFRVLWDKTAPTTNNMRIQHCAVFFSWLYAPCTWKLLDVLTLVLNKSTSWTEYSSHFVIVLKLIVGFSWFYLWLLCPQKGREGLVSWNTTEERGHFTFPYTQKI